MLLDDFDRLWSGSDYDSDFFELCKGFHLNEWQAFLLYESCIKMIDHRLRSRSDAIDDFDYWIDSHFPKDR